MPSSICLRSLSQLSLETTTRSSIAARNLLIAPQVSCFSTSIVRYGMPLAKKKNMNRPPPKRGTKTLRIKKTKKASTEKKGLSSTERKAIRKRIVLSNNNALEVPGLQDLTARDALSAENEGKVKGIPDEAVDILRAVGAFKPRQGWGMFRRPAMLMRKETLQLAKLMKDVEQSAEGQRKTVRRIIHGERMSGKSTLLLQGLTMAYLKGWTIINLPEGQDIVNAHTEYAPLPESQPTQYTQDTYTSSLLSQMIQANGKLLASTKVSGKPDIPLPLPAGATLEQLAKVGVTDPEASWPVFVALWKELNQPGRPPIIFAVDGLSHIMRDSEYFSAEVKPIHAHDLTLIRHFTDLFSGKTTLTNGGVILGVMTGSNSPANPAVEYSIQTAEARQHHPDNMPQWNPYKNVDTRVVDCLKSVDSLKISGLSKDEARSIMEYYAQSGMLRAQVSESLVTERWSLAGMGNVGELERATVRLRA